MLTGITLAAILWFTLAPHPTGDLDIPLFPGADKVVHAIMFGSLTLVALLETMKHRNWVIIPLGAIAAVAFISAGLGIGIEFLQKAMGLGRQMEILDILADTAGSFGAAGIWAMIQKTFQDPNNLK